jgi:cytochrome P450
MRFIQFHVLSEDGLILILLDLFSAGAESVANSLDYALLYLTLNPHIQRKVHEELDAVVGRSRRPSMDDRSLYDKQCLCRTYSTLQRLSRLCRVNNMAHAKKI